MDTIQIQDWGPAIWAVIIVFAIALSVFLNSGRKRRAIIADFETENEIKGEVEAVLIMPYIPGGWSSMDREEQTLIIFKNGERVRVEGLHPEIKKGETWHIKYAGTGKYALPLLIEKKRK